MANTTNFNWETPDDTDLVKDGAAAIRTLGSAIDTSLVDLKGGTTGQVLSKATNTDMDFTWVTSDDANAIQNAIVDAKGDLIAASAADTPARLAVGTDNQRLVAASGEATGLKYVSDTQNTVIDAAGDLLYGTAADTLARLPIGTAGQVLKVNSGATAPEWGAAAGGGDFVLINTTSFSAVSSQSVNDVFSSTYDNYVIKLNNCTGSTDLFVALRLRVSGTDTTTNYRYQNIQADSTTVAGSRSTSATSFPNVFYINSGFDNEATLNIANPFNTKRTTGFSHNVTGGGGNIEFNVTGYGLNDATSYTGFTLLTSTGNMTGSVSVYGYKK